MDLLPAAALGVLPATARGWSQRCLFALALLVTILGFAADASAHTLGLSQSEFVLESPTSVRGVLVLSKRDAVHLGRMDRNGDGTVTPEELAASEATFREAVQRGVVVRSDGALCPATLQGGGDVEEDGFGLAMTFACEAPPSVLEVSLPLLRDLSPGHRDLARLTAHGRTVDRTLTAADPTLSASVEQGGPAEVASAAPEVAPALGNAFALGIEHILTGWDHLLFLAVLLMGTRDLRALLAAVTAFTVAHSLTLAVAALGLWTPSARWVEPLIAASITYVAFENVVLERPTHRWRVTFAFGLVHGFGFAGALAGLAIPRERLLPTLLGFNLGVEAGQLGVLGMALPLFRRLLRPHGAPRARWVVRASALVGLVGLGLCIMRLF